MRIRTFFKEVKLTLQSGEEIFVQPRWVQRAEIQEIWDPFHINTKPGEIPDAAYRRTRVTIELEMPFIVRAWKEEGMDVEAGRLRGVTFLNSPPPELPDEV